MVSGGAVSCRSRSIPAIVGRSATWRGRYLPPAAGQSRSGPAYSATLLHEVVKRSCVDAIGNFADQIYPIYALSKFATAFDLEEPLDAALECAMVVCHLQGNLGQWWWFYDVETGRVACHLPRLLRRSIRSGAAGAVRIGTCHGKKFSGCDLPRFGLGLRGKRTGRGSQDSFSRADLEMYCSEKPAAKISGDCSKLYSPNQEHVAAESLHVLHESRPFELGMLLCSFAKHGIAES